MRYGTQLSRICSTDHITEIVGEAREEAKVGYENTVSQDLLASDRLARVTGK
jgi:hypothetical protein